MHERVIRRRGIAARSTVVFALAALTRVGMGRERRGLVVAAITGGLAAP